eukprot:TRINITY_DN9710_c0_g3_i1.p1 TRINITY_DN9710_c0_g3~~TRINITY_DN9710_c0_g3_i1.p1  ORF type:complete len:286 (+),score=52.21 TRINITY_DN9710_c0_g3_i1:152-1009(+)
MMASLCIISRNGGAAKERKPVSLDKVRTFAELLNVCSTKLGCNAKRLFREDGHEITSLGEIQEDEALLVSEGEDFVEKASEGGLNESSVFRFAIIGPVSVGKSAISLRYFKNSFEEDYVPTLEDEYFRDVIIDGERARVVILDTAGLEGFVSLRMSWIQRKDGIILVYSVDKRSTFDELDSFYTEIRQAYPSRDIELALAANKIDLPREVGREEGVSMARNIGAEYFEVSAKLNQNVSDMFTHLVRTVRTKRVPVSKRTSPNTAASKPRPQPAGSRSFLDWCSCI